MSAPPSTSATAPDGASAFSPATALTGGSARAPATSPTNAGAFAVEATAIGPQTLVPGVVPITPRDRLAARAAAPLEATKPQRPCDLGLFDLNARNQLDLFQPKEL